MATTDKAPTTEELLDRTYEQMVLFERRLDSQEELIANMMLAYSQLTSTLTALTEEVMAPRSDEEKRAFQVEMRQRHLELLQTMQEATRGMETSGPDIATAVEDLVRDEPTPGTVEQ